MYLTQKTKTVLVTTVAAILAIMFGIGLVKLTDPIWVHTHANMAPLWFLVVAKLLFLLSYILFVIQGFRTHWGWGCANLFIPVSALVFLFVHPKRAKAPAIIWACGLTAVLLMLLWWKISQT